MTTNNRLLSLLERHFSRLRVTTSRELQALAGTSQATISRALASLGDRLVVLGRGRSARYALAVPAFGQGHRIPIYRVDAQGRALLAGDLRPLAGGGFYVQPADEGETWMLGERGDGLFDGLPYYLDDLRPQGFLGRRAALNLGAPYPPDLRDWSAEHIGRYLCDHGTDGPGDLLLGEGGHDHDNARQVAIDADYPALARAALDRGPPGSSAGGEQPKFTAFTGAGHVIVKFAHADDPAGARWRDLLIAEHEALAYLRKLDVPTAESRIIHEHECDRGWTFLEVRRFDRVGRAGRLPVLSLAAVDAEYVGHGRDWLSVSTALLARGLIEASDAERISTAYAFGRLIWNDDMHLGNLSLRPGADGFTLLPVYDMLPMRFRPQPAAQAVTDRSFQDRTGIPDEVAAVAIAYWSAVARHPAISQGFAKTASAARDALADVMTRLPDDRPPERPKPDLVLE